MKIIGIYPGNFQPPHKGHYDSYKRIRSFVGPDTFVVTTDYDPSIVAPLHFGDKEQILVRHGIPDSHIKKVKNVNTPWEVLNNYDPKTTVVIYALNQKEAEKKIRSSKYYEDLGLKTNKDLLPFKQRAYIFVINDSRVGNRIFSSKNVREALGSHRFTNEQKKKWFKHFFGWFDLGLFELLKDKYTNAQQSDVFAQPPSDIKEELKKEVEKIMNELMGSPPSIATDDSSYDSAPTVDNMKSDAEKRKEASQNRMDLIKQKSQAERELKAIQTDRKWKEKSLLNLRKDQEPNKRKEIDTLNQQISTSATNPPSMGT